MSSERMMILNMVSDGKLTVDEASLLLESIARLEVDEPIPSQENPPTTEIVAEPEPVSDTTLEIAAPIEQTPDSFEERAHSKRNIWKSVKHYLQRFRLPYPS